MKRRISPIQGLELLILAAFAIACWGCAQNTDASDSSPDYYKGKQFVHKKAG